MGKRYLNLEDISAYDTSFNLSNYLWNIVIKWDYFSKDTIGKQFVKAVDSISSNIAEGFGRYYKKDMILFYRYARGSVFESLNWLRKADKRGLLEEKDCKYILNELQKLPKDINSLIKFTKEKLKK